jgi:hypothetical protein
MQPVGYKDELPGQKATVSAPVSNDSMQSQELTHNVNKYLRHSLDEIQLGIISPKNHVESVLSPGVWAF